VTTGNQRIAQPAMLALVQQQLIGAAHPRE